MELANRVWQFWCRLRTVGHHYWSHWAYLFRDLSVPPSKSSSSSAPTESEASGGTEKAPSELWIPEEELKTIPQDEELCLFLLL